MKNLRTAALKVEYRRMRSRSGLASALIILVLVLLIFFAVLSMVASAADLRLSKKRADWNRQYYLADSAAVALYADLDMFCRSRPEMDLDQDKLAAVLETWLAVRSNVREFQISDETGALRVRVLVMVQPAAQTNNSNSNQKTVQQQGIEMTLLIRTGQPSEPANRLSVAGWTQWQMPFEYDQGNGGIWKG
jgi:biopolymer transport protein ExbD